MKVLLDTHALLWWAFGGRALPPKVEKLLGDPANQVFVSAAAFWEIAIKVRRNKLKIPITAEAFVEQIQSRTRTDIVQMTAEHAVVAGGLDRHHDDPFDRMMVAQCILERMHIATNDADIQKYPVRVIWA